MNSENPWYDLRTFLSVACWPLEEVISDGRIIATRVAGEEGVYKNRDQGLLMDRDAIASSLIWLACKHALKWNERFFHTRYKGRVNLSVGANDELVTSLGQYASDEKKYGMQISSCPARHGIYFNTGQQ